jgi:hypothetical protein
MPVLVTASELRAVLGVPVALYSDAALDSIIETSEDAIGDFLIQWKVGIDAHRYESATVAIIHTTRPHKFYVGQTIAHSGVEAKINGSKTVTIIVDEYTYKITVAAATPHQDFNATIPNGIAAANDLSQYNGVDAVEEAVLQIAVDVFQSRLAAGGTQQALDYTPAPYRMGRTLLYKVTGLISKYIDSNSQVG